MARQTTFTTFFTTQVDTSAGAKVDALANQISSAYTRISTATAAAGRAGVALDGSTTSTTRFAAATRQTNTAVTEAATRNEQFAKSLSSVATTLGVVQGPLGPLAGRVRALSSALTELTGLKLGLAGIGAALFTLGSFGSEYANLASRIRPFVENQQAANSALADIVGIAQRSRSALEPIAQLYIRLTTLKPELPTGTNISSLTETIAKSSTLSGGSAQNQEQGIVQLVQGLGRGILNGQDLRALEEDSYNLAKTIADGLGVNVGKLKQLGAEGKLTTEVVTAALVAQAQKVSYQFSLLPLTLSTATQQFKTSLLTTIGGIDQSVGLTNSLAQGLSAVATNLRGIIALGGGFAAAFALPRGLAILSSTVAGIATQISDVYTRSEVQNAASKAAIAGTGAGFTTAGPAYVDRSNASQVALAQARADQQAAASTAQATEAEVARTAAMKTRYETAVLAAQAQVAAAREELAAEIGLDDEQVVRTQRANTLRSQGLAQAQARLAEIKTLNAEQAAASAATVGELEDELAQRKAILAAMVEQKAQAESSLLANQRAQPLLVAQQDAAVYEPDYIAKKAAVAEGNAAIAAGEIEVAKYTALSEGAARKAADATIALGDAREASSVQSVAAARAETAAELDVASATNKATIASEDYTAAVQASTVATTERRNVDLATALRAETTAQTGLAQATKTHVAAAEADTVATEALGVATEEVTVKQKAATVTSGFLGTALSAVGGAIFSLPTLIFAATTAFILLAQRTNEAHDAAENFAGGQDELRRQLGLTIDQLHKATDAQKQFAIESAKDAVSTGRQKAEDSASAIASELKQAAASITLSRGNSDDAKLAVQLAAQLNNLGSPGAPSFDLKTLEGQVAGLKSRNPDAFQSTFLNRFLKRDPSQILTDVTGLGANLISLGNAQKTLTTTQTATNSGIAQVDLSGTGNDAKISVLQANAKAAVDTGKANLDALNDFNAAVDKLNGEFKVTKGAVGADGAEGVGDDKVTGGKTADTAYQARYQALYQRYRDTVNANDAAKTQQTHDDRADMVSAREAINVDAINKQIALEQKRFTMSSEDYEAENRQILANRDTQLNALSDTTARAHSAKQAQLDDLKKINDEAIKNTKTISDIVTQYAPEAPAQRKFDTTKATLQNLVDDPQKSGTQATIISQDEINRIIQQLNPVQNKLNDLYDEIDRNRDVSLLNAQGLTAEATALQKAYDLQKNTGNLSAQDLDKLIAKEREEERINDLIQDRQQVTSNLMGVVGQTRDALASLLETGKVGNFFKQLQTNFKDTFAQNLSIQLTSGLSDSVRNLFKSKSPADQAQAALAKSISTASSRFDSYNEAINAAISSSTKLATALDNLTGHVNTAATGSTTGSGTGGLAGLAATTSDVSSDQGLANPGTLPAGLNANNDALAASISQSLQDSFGDNSGATGNIIDVTAKKSAVAAAKASGGGSSTSLVDVYNATGAKLVSNITAPLNALGAKLGGFGEKVTGVVSSGISFLGKNLGNALQGAGVGLTAGGLILGNSGSAGSSQAKLGEALGGAAGDVAGKALGKTLSNASSSIAKTLGSGLSSTLGSVAPVIGSVLGSVAGGLIGKLFAKKILGASTITSDSNGNLTSSASGNSSKAEAAATSEASTVISGINQIAQALGAQITQGSQITVGTYKGKYRVQTAGTQLKGGGSEASTLRDFGDDQDAAIQYAIVASIQNGVIKGISQASINILKSGQDLQTALTKATAIENIPKQLEQLTNPVAYAVDSLNEQFSTLIDYLNEGGATAQQYAQAQELYDKERATAIQQAAKSVFGTVEDYIKQLTDSTDSPLNKTTVYSNSKTSFSALAAQIDAGQTVDQDALVTAAKNYQDASRALNGSNVSFFSDYNYILEELQKADATATAESNTSADQTGLAASPFTTDPTALNALTSIGKASTDAVAAQTTTLTAAINAVTTAVNALNTSGVSDTLKASAISLLAGVRAAS